MNFLLISLLTLCCYNGCDSANILGLFNFNGYSHFAVFKVLLEELARRGHNVDVVSHFPLKTPIPGYTDINIQGTLPELRNTFEPEALLKSTSILEDLFKIFGLAGDSVCRSTFNHTKLVELKSSKKKYDLIITEIFFNDCLLGFAHQFGAPVIAMISSVNLPWASDRVGLPDNPSYVPNYFVASTSDMTYLGRLYNFFILYLSKLWYEFYALEVTNRSMREFFGDIPHVGELVKNTSMVMVNSHFSLQQSRPTPPNFLEIGGIHIRENFTLPNNIEDSIKTNSNDVIYLSFGSLFNTNLFKEDKLTGLLDALKELPYKVLWKGDRSKFPKHLDIPANVQFEPWLPQLALLCNENVKLFISHGGLLGTQETIYCGTPVLTVPIWADQVLNGRVIADKGIGLYVPFAEISKEKIFNAAKEILENPSYKSKANELSRLFRDRPIKPLESAVYWSEYIIKHKGAPHLRSKGADLPWYQFYCIDILLIPFLILIVIIFTLFRIFRIFLSMFTAREKIKVS